ncbi:MAG: right-handed parallel beta-helix repeat-containing protein [Pirellulaceae bacterium]
MSLPSSRNLLIAVTAAVSSYGWAAAAGGVEQGVIHVAIQGNDAWSGASTQPNADGTDGPLATLGAAVQVACQWPADTARRIVIHAGTYYLEQPVTLDERHSGLSIEPAEGQKVLIRGGRKITDWQRDGDRFWSATLPEIAAGKWDFRVLEVGGRFCRRARLPREGCFQHQTRFDVPWMSTTGGGWKRKPTQEELTTLEYMSEDLGPWLDIKNAELTVYHMWDESLVGVDSLDPARHIVRFAQPAGHPPGGFGVQKYVVWNVREGMTEPGQWYLDRTAGKVVYWPLDDEDMSQVEVIAATTPVIFHLSGSHEKPVSNVSLRRLDLAVTNVPLEPGGFGASRFDGAITVHAARNLSLLRLSIANTGGQGIKMSDVENLRVEDCEFRQTGASGMIVHGDGVIANNHVHHVGLLYPSAVGVMFGGGHEKTGGLHIRHNEVHDTPYTALCGGGSDHCVEANLIYGAMQELHDGAGIYISMCKRITLRGNLIRDIVDTGGYGASAYYLDEQAEDCLVESNLSFNVARPSHNHMARRNTIRGNVFITDGPAQITFPRSSEFCFENNVIVAQGKIQFTNPDAMTHVTNNVVFSREGTVEGVVLQDYATQTTEAIRTGGGWMLADPRLLEFETGKVRYAPDSPVLQLGLTPIDVRNAGRQPPVQ